MFGGDQCRSRSLQWSTTSGQQGEGQHPPAQPSPSSSGMIPGAPSFYDPNAVGQQPQPSLDDHQWLHSTTQQFTSGVDTGAYSIPYRQQQPQSSSALLHESFSQQQQQAAPRLLNQYSFVAPQYQATQQTQFSTLDQPGAPSYRPQVLSESYLYGQVPSDPAQNAQNASRVENYPYARHFQLFNSPLSELANNPTPSSSSSELLAYPPPRGPSVSPAVSDRSPQNPGGPTPPPPPTSSTSAANPVVTAAEPNPARNKAARNSKKRKGAKRLKMDEYSTTDTEEDEILSGGANLSVHLTQPPRGPGFVFPARL